jgi:hypothetical protein
MISFKEACYRGNTEVVEFYLCYTMVNYGKMGLYFCKSGRLDLFDKYFVEKYMEVGDDKFCKDYMYADHQIYNYNHEGKLMRDYVKFLEAHYFRNFRTNEFANRFKKIWPGLKDLNRYKRIMEGAKTYGELYKTPAKRGFRIPEFLTVFLLKYANIELLIDIRHYLCRTKWATKIMIKKNNPDVFKYLKTNFVKSPEIISSLIFQYDAGKIDEQCKFSKKYLDFAAFAQKGLLTEYMTQIMPGYIPTFNDVLKAITTKSRFYFPYFLQLYPDVEVKNAILTVSCKCCDKWMMDYVIHLGAAECNNCGLIMQHKKRVIHVNF